LSDLTEWIEYKSKRPYLLIQPLSFPRIITHTKKEKVIHVLVLLFALTNKSAQNNPLPRSNH